MARNFTMIFYGPKGSRWALVAPGGCLEGYITHQGVPPTASLLYKYPNISKTLE